MDQGIERIFHVNIVCRDLDRSLAFYTDVLGMHIVEGPYDSEGPVLAGIGEGSQAWGFKPDETKIRFAFLRFGDDDDETILDLLEWVQPRSYGAPHPNLQQIGIARIALRVSNITPVFGRLQGRGVKFITEPVPLEIGEDLLTGVHYCCFYDPDGTILELYGPAGPEGS